MNNQIIHIKSHPVTGIWEGSGRHGYRDGHQRNGVEGVWRYQREKSARERLRSVISLTQTVSIPRHQSIIFVDRFILAIYGSSRETFAPGVYS